MTPKPLTPFQRTVGAAFLAIMRARRPDLVWTLREPGKIREDVPGPGDRDALSDRHGARTA